MKSFLTFFLAALLSTTTAAPFWHKLVQRDVAVPPSQDAFYVQPSNINSYKPGAIIRSRSLPATLPGLNSGENAGANLKSVTQYMYRTTDGLGDPVAAVNTLLVPNLNADNMKLLSFQTHYDTANNDCSPSWTLRPESNNTAGDDEIFMIAGLNKGWYVVTSDYEGLEAQFTAGLMAGYGTLDSLRAVLSSTSTATSGLSPKARHVLWGYSGGALASEWAAELAPKYAPELKIQGAALGGLTPNVTNVLYTINGGQNAGLTFTGIAGLTRIWPNATKWLNDNLIPSKAAEFRRFAAECSNTNNTSGKNIGDYFINGFASLNEPIPQQLLETNGQMGYHSTPKIPLYFYKAAEDEISPVGDTDALYARYCAKGATIQYDRNVLGDHFSEVVTGAGAAIEWVEDRLNGIAVSNQGECVKNTVVESSLDVADFLDLGAVLIAALLALL